jgi:serine/threonine protein kinase
MALSVEQFIARLSESGLMSPAEVSTFQESLPPAERPRDVQALAAGLVKAGKLTKYQAQAVYQGKTKGLVFGEYLVLDKLGEGGMGVVLKARHRRMDRLVAIKVLSAGGMKAPEAVERFHREVKAAAKLSHPNIVTAHDAGEHQGMHYLVTEYVAGKDLAAIVKEHGPLDVQAAVECTLQAARGLQYAHEQGIIHRDIKPGNLLLDKKGTVKILDMGLARLEASASRDDSGGERLTRSGQVMGTCEYMAPEQAFDTHMADARSDIYSLGCTLYRLLIGQPPYQGETLVLVGLAGALLLLLGTVLTLALRHGTTESRIQDLKSQITNPQCPPPPTVAPFDAKKAKEHQEAWARHLGVPVEITNSIGMKLVLIPPGEFTMGSPKELIEEELKRPDNEQWYRWRLPGEGPQHRVRITKPFYLGRYVVTQGEYEKVMGNNPSEFSATGKQKDKVGGQDTKRFLVEGVSWDEAVEFCRKLSERPEEKAAGRRYRLPSEAQWEYACRAGNTGRFSFSPSNRAIPREYDEHGLEDCGWFGYNSGRMPHAVGLRRGNPWSLYDMHGNVWEWCQDWYDKDWYVASPADDPSGPPGGSDRVLRGGSWCHPAGNCRSARRDNGDATRYRSYDAGFRVSLVLADK